MTHSLNSQTAESKEYFANYLVGDSLGRRNGGVLYRVRDVQGGSSCELFIICSERLRKLSQIESEAAVETHIGRAARLKHRRIEPVADYGIHQGRPYVVFPFSSESTLRRFFREEDSHLPLHTVVKLARQMLRALNAAHEKKIYHHDLTPDNILLAIGEEGEKLIKLRGLGLASLLAGDKSNLSLMTRSSETMASPEYMSPELFVGDTADQRADLYSLGIVLCELLTGSVPYKSDSIIDLMLAHRSEEIPELDIARYGNSEAANSFAAFIRSLLAADPRKRIQSADSALEMLEEAVAGHALFAPSGSEKDAPQRSFSGRVENISVGEVSEIGASSAHIANQASAQENGRGRTSRSQEFWRVGFAVAACSAVVLAVALVVMTKERARDENLAMLLAESKRQALPVASTATPEKQEIRASMKSSRSEEVTEAVTDSGLVDRTPGDSDSEISGEVSPIVNDTTEEGVVASVLEEPREPLDQTPRDIQALGIRVRPVSAKDMEVYGLRDSAGLLVEEVSKESRAYAAGLREKDLLQKVETKGESILAWKPREVRRTADLENAIDEARLEEQRLALIIKRGNFGGLVVFIPTVG